MSSSLPVPSKVALTALRGLALGTTCTLALIVEDRRRRINYATRIIENGEKIKSAKRYRAGGGALAVAMEEEALWDPGLLSAPRVGLVLHPLDSHAGEHSTSSTRILKTRDVNVGAWGAVDAVAGASEVESGARVVVKDEVVLTDKKVDAGDSSSNTKSSTSSFQRRRKAERAPIPVPDQTRTASVKSAPSWLLTNADVIQAYVPPTMDEIVERMHEACRTRDSMRIRVAMRDFLEVLGRTSSSNSLDQAWIEASALLCRTCQEEGRVDDAAKLLLAVMGRGPLEESAYINHEPFRLIESLLARSTMRQRAPDACLVDLDAAINLFLPTLTQPPTDPSQQLYSIGRKLLDACFSANRLQRIFGMYRRCNLVAGAHSEDLTSWFLTSLHGKQDYKSVVKVFLSTYAHCSPTEASVHAIGDKIVESVELGHNYRSEQVLRALHGICASLSTKLNPIWVTKLFVSHWKQHNNLETIETLFKELHTPSLSDSVFRSDGIHRVMVELALEAGAQAKADAYFAAATAQNRALASDVRLLGVRARFHAKDGDWEAVRADFEAMRHREKSRNKAYGQVFVPVLKSYAETHTVRETEAFLKSYADDLGVPLCSYTVTLMAKQYGAARDVESLIGWLDYCSQAGFPADAAFTNAILVRCRRQWNMPFRDIRTLYRKLKILNPDFVDKHTEQTMADAALSDSKYGGRAAKGRLLSLRVDPTKLSLQGKQGTAVEDVTLAMKEALTTGRPRRAVWLYKRAMHVGMLFSQQALRLAVQAQLQLAPGDYHGAYSLIQAAQARGHDTNTVVNYLIAQQLSSITPDHNPTEAYDTIKTTLAGYQVSGIRLTDTALHHAAQACLRAGHHHGAIVYANEAAASTSPPSEPCFNLANFKILLAAHAERVDLAGLHDTVRRGLADGGSSSSAYMTDAGFRTALSRARMRVTHAREWGVTETARVRARALLDYGIRRAVEARRELRGDRKQLERAALRIMKRAARDAGCPEVDFKSVPWLGGGRKEKGEVGDGREVGGEEKEASDDEFSQLEYFGVLQRETTEAARAAAVATF